MWDCAKENRQYVRVFVSGHMALCSVWLIDGILIAFDVQWSSMAEEEYHSRLWLHGLCCLGGSGDFWMLSIHWIWSWYMASKAHTHNHAFSFVAASWIWHLAVRTAQTAQHVPKYMLCHWVIPQIREMANNNKGNSHVRLLKSLRHFWRAHLKSKQHSSDWPPTPAY